MVAVRNTNWLANLGVYMVPLVERGLLGQLWVQWSGAPGCAAPFGGIDKRLSTSPFSLAFPTSSGAMISDFSATASSMGKIARMDEKGERPPEPIYMTADGRPSDDPAVARGEGSVQFTGGMHYGYKGYTIALWAEALTAAGGGRCTGPDTPAGQSASLIVIDPQALGGSETYLAGIDALTSYVKSSRPREGFDEVRLPGEKALMKLAAARRDGLELEDEQVESLNAVARNNHIEGIPAVPE